MVQKLYVVYDKLGERVNFPITAYSLEQAIRENTPMLYQLNRDFEKEYALFEVGYFDSRSSSPCAVHVLDDVVRHDWTEYEHFTSIVDRMSARERELLSSQQPGVTDVPLDKKQ